MEEQVWFSFDGDDYCEDCRGWDGESRRCDCGNRRVAWSCLKDNCDKEQKDCIDCDDSYPEAW